MKRLIALMLLCAMALAAVPGLAADDYTIEEKFYRQAMLESAYKGTLTLSVTGNGTALISPALWSALKAAAPRLSVEIDHSYASRQREGQATATLLLDGQNAGKTTFLYNDRLIGLSSDLLAGGNTYYTADREWDPRDLLYPIALGDNAWPPMLGVLYAVATAPQEWQDRAAPYLTPYETKLSIWLNGFSSFSTGTDEDGVAYTEMHFSIPALAVKSELKQLLVDLYGNTALLTLLREAIPAREAAAYLDASMLNGFLMSVDGLQLSGDMDIIRRYDSQGHSLLDRIQLPFTEDQYLTALSIAVRHTGEGADWHVTGKTREGADFDFQCLAGEDMIYTGAAEITLPPEEEAGFVVDDGNGQEGVRRTVAFDYNLIWEPGEETYDLATDKFQHTYKASLLIKPKGEDAGPSQSLALEATFSSGSSKRSATRLDATLEWRDLDSEASILLRLDSRTVAPFTVASLNQVTGAVRVDQMNGQNREALLNRWTQTCQAWITTLAARLTLPGLPAAALEQRR